MDKFNPLKRAFWQKPDRKIVVDLIVAVVIFIGAVVGFDLNPETSATGAFVIGKIIGYIVPNNS